MRPSPRVGSTPAPCRSSFGYDKYAKRFLGGYCFRFIRRFSLAAMTERIANAVGCCMPCSEWDLSAAEAYG